MLSILILSINIHQNLAIILACCIVQNNRDGLKILNEIFHWIQNILDPKNIYLNNVLF